jgi:hypothetical protein
MAAAAKQFLAKVLFPCKPKPAGTSPRDILHQVAERRKLGQNKKTRRFPSTHLKHIHHTFQTNLDSSLLINVAHNSLNFRIHVRQKLLGFGIARRRMINQLSQEKRILANALWVLLRNRKPKKRVIDDSLAWV